MRREGITLKFKNKEAVISYMKKLGKSYMYKIQPIMVLKEISSINDKTLKKSFESIIVTDNEYHIKYFEKLINEFYENYDTKNYSILSYELYINILTDKKKEKEYEKEILLKLYRIEEGKLEKVLNYIKKKIKNTSSRIHK